jgi:hypothetical protein
MSAPAFALQQPVLPQGEVLIELRDRHGFRQLIVPIIILSLLMGITRWSNRYQSRPDEPDQLHLLVNWPGLLKR